MTAAATILLLRGAGDTQAALAKHCPRGDIAVAADIAAALDYLRGRGSASLPPPRLIVFEPAAGADAAATVANLKADADLRLIPLVVLLVAGDTAASDACYRAGANACLLKPDTAAALSDAVAALASFWCDANEVPAAPD